MPISELLLYGAVEALQVSVRLGVLGIIEEMHQPLILTGSSEVLLKFTAVVGLDSFDGKRCYGDELVQEITAVRGRIGGIGVGKGKPCFHIDGSEQVALYRRRRCGRYLFEPSLRGGEEQSLSCGFS